MWLKARWVRTERATMRREHRMSIRFDETAAVILGATTTKGTRVCRSVPIATAGKNFTQDCGRRPGGDLKWPLGHR